jgi:hypothetical protein
MAIRSAAGAERPVNGLTPRRRSAPSAGRRATLRRRRRAMAPHHAHGPEARPSRVGPARCGVRRRRVDRDAVVAAVSDQVPHDASQRLRTDSAAMQRGIQEHVDPRHVDSWARAPRRTGSAPRPRRPPSIVSRVASGSSPPAAGLAHPAAPPLPRERGDHGAHAHLPSGSGQTGVRTATQAGDLPCRVARSAATSRSDLSPRHPPQHLRSTRPPRRERRPQRRARRRAARTGQRGTHAHRDGCNDPRTPAPARNSWPRLGRFAAVVHGQ